MPSSKNLKDPQTSLSIKYSCLQLVQRGLRSVVFKGVDNTSSELVAIKAVPKTFYNKCMGQEARVLQLLDHPQIIKFKETLEDEHNVYIVTEYCSGGDLLQFIKAKRRIDEYTTIVLVRQILSALVYLHSKGLAHLDLKPENILMANTCNTQLKLADFGFAQEFMGKPYLSEARGTLVYAAPEILLKNYSEKADCWAVGVIVFVMLTGEVPFHGSSPDAVAHNIMYQDLDYSRPCFSTFSPAAVDFLSRLLTKNPSQRLSAEEAQQHPWLQVKSASRYKILYEIEQATEEFVVVGSLGKVSLK
mmetsp:Transcript_15267/g.27815  ORF Transcript_15267/g.27815 Transcript_15267/m.27815 type:complete len:303 (+) Transcript_15267:50-958(+)